MEGAGIDQGLRELVELLLGTVTPVDLVGLGERCYFLDPRLEACMVGAGMVLRCGVGHIVLQLLSFDGVASLPGLTPRCSRRRAARRPVPCAARAPPA